MTPKKIDSMPKTLDEKQAETYAAVIAALEDGTKLQINIAKGRWWNAAPRGCRKELCKRYGWNYRGVGEYGKIVKAFELVLNRVLARDLKSWKTLECAYRAPGDKVQWLKLALKHNWTAARLQEAIDGFFLTHNEEDYEFTVKLLFEDPEPFMEEEVKKKVFQRAEVVATRMALGRSRTSKSNCERKEVKHDVTEDSNDWNDEYEENLASAQMKRQLNAVTEGPDAFAMFGMIVQFGVYPTLTRETFNTLVRHYAKRYHPDMETGSNKLMTKFNKAKEFVTYSHRSKRWASWG